MAIGFLLRKTWQDKFDDVRIVEIQTCLWKIWLTKNHGWMKIFIQLWKKEENKNKGMKTLDEKYYNQIMDENLPFGWKLNMIK